MGEKSEIELPAAAQGLVDYWASARGDLELPTKAAIDPLRLRAWVGDLSIVDLREGAQRFWVRLQGSNVSAQIGTGFERRYLEERIPAELHAVALKPYHTSIEEKLPTFSIIRPGQLTGVFDQLIRLILPFSGNDNSDVERFLVWAGQSNRNRFECETVYGSSAAPSSPIDDDAASLVVLRPDRVLGDAQASMVS